MSLQKIGIIGGGPSGLLTAFLLERRSHSPCDITIFEAQSRLDGKVVSRQFKSAPVLLEAGVAELYDYSHLGHDPLRELIDELGFSVIPMGGTAVVLGDCIIKSEADVASVFGAAADRALKRFKRMARDAISPAEYYESDWQADNKNPLSRKTFHQLLAQVKDEDARRYLQVLVHSDLATEPHQTNAMYGLQNYLMNEPDYMRLYTIDGGLESLPRALAARVKAHVLLNHRVLRVEKTAADLYRVFSREGDEIRSDDFDYLVVALPNNWIPSIAWGGPVLADAMHRHHVLYDYPAHYVRVSILFEKPFWREQIAGSYFMLDAFGGCCVYDQSPRDSASSYGVLSWLLPGEAALSVSNYDDAMLIEAVLESLPRSLRHGRQHFVEGNVFRWVGSVTGLPGGFPARDPDLRHQPEPEHHEKLFVVGDYLFDATLNGILDSADVVAELILEYVEETVAAASDPRPSRRGTSPHPHRTS